MSFSVLTVKKFLGDLYDVVDKEDIAKKIQCYKDFLDVMIKVDPGYPTVCTTMPIVYRKWQLKTFYVLKWVFQVSMALLKSNPFIL